MFGIGMPELLIIAVLFFGIYGIIITIDALRRPKGQYKFGRKPFWVLLLILSNPLITRLIGREFFVLGAFVFIIGSIVYHATNRWKNPITKIKKARTGWPLDEPYMHSAYHRPHPFCGI
jgi:predicted membrane channel-forming protein YqfA (hemolysin III family)